jgi:type VI secretion system secreted protein Hcp
MVSALAVVLITGLYVSSPKAEAVSPQAGKRGAGSGDAIHLSIEGAKQGKFKGSHAKRSDAIVARGLSFDIISPRDVASGQASGKRQYKPIQITKPIDGSTPQILQALATNEVLKSVTFEFVRTNPNGEEEVWYVIKLTNATVSAYHQGNDTNGQPSEEVCFTFQKIEVEHKTDKTTYADDWMK